MESLRSGLPAPDLCEEKFMSGQSEESTLPALLCGEGGLRLLENHCYTVGNAGKKDICRHQPDSHLGPLYKRDMLAVRGPCLVLGTERFITIAAIINMPFGPALIMNLRPDHPHLT